MKGLGRDRQNYVIRLVFTCINTYWEYNVKGHLPVKGSIQRPVCCSATWVLTLQHDRIIWKILLERWLCGLIFCTSLACVVKLNIFPSIFAYLCKQSMNLTWRNMAQGHLYAAAMLKAEGLHIEFHYIGSISNVQCQVKIMNLEPVLSLL